MNDTLEVKVDERTRELSEANIVLKNTMSELREAHDQLVLSEKMAALGQLVAGIAHELNTPLGAIISANGMAENFAVKFINELSSFVANLDDDSKALLEKLIEDIHSAGLFADPALVREKRKHFAALSARENLAVNDSIIEDLIDFGYAGTDDDFRALSVVKQYQEIVRKVYQFSIIIRSMRIIKTAAGKAAGVVGALKTYSHHDSSGEMTETSIVDDIEMILTLYYNQLKEGVEVVKRYHAKPAAKCYPEKLHQVWVNIINNALHAMNHSGRLEVEVDEVDNEVLVSITDNGPGIPEEIQGKIFTPFFTTKVAGEGSGLGLDICRRIVEQIGGRISFVSVPGRTTFSIRLKM
jgi:signal transduction histidine kinase